MQINVLDSDIATIQKFSDNIGIDCIEIINNSIS